VAVRLVPRPTFVAPLSGVVLLTMGIERPTTWPESFMPVA
jgi:hypothetical protein